MRPIITAARVVLGGYLVAHGAQKLFGAFGGPGLDATAEAFDSLGLTPGRQTAALASVTEIGGGTLTATGIAHPLGPLMIAGSMSVASVVHRQAGPFAANEGYEQPLTNLAFAATLAALGTAGYHPGRPLSRRLTAVATIGGVALGAAMISKLLHATPGAEAEAATDVSES